MLEFYLGFLEDPIHQQNIKSAFFKDMIKLNICNNTEECEEKCADIDNLPPGQQIAIGLLAMGNIYHYKQNRIDAVKNKQ